MRIHLQSHSCLIKHENKTRHLSGYSGSDEAGYHYSACYAGADSQCHRGRFSDEQAGCVKAPADPSRMRTSETGATRQGDAVLPPDR